MSNNISSLKYREIFESWLKIKRPWNGGGTTTYWISPWGELYMYLTPDGAFESSSDYDSRNTKIFEANFK